MHEQTIDSLTRRVAAGVSRRDAILVLGGAGLASLAELVTADASKKRKRKKNRKKNEKKCKRQEGQCNGVFEPLCAEEGAPEECLERTRECCASLRDCQADEFLNCFLEFLNIGEAPV